MSLNEVLIPASQNVTFTPVEFLALKDSIWWLCIQYGYIAFVLGVILGGLAAYALAKYRFERGYGVPEDVE